MPVEITVDHWNPDQKRYRFETFSYGPRSCARYRPGPTRKVPGRRGMTYEEEDWIDAEETAHRGPDGGAEPIDRDTVGRERATAGPTREPVPGEFPVFSLQIRDLGRETGSHQTAPPPA